MARDDKKDTNKPASAPVVAVRYIGDGAFWPGIPARDLTREEWDALEPEHREQILAHKLYEEVGTYAIT